MVQMVDKLRSHTDKNALSPANLPSVNIFVSHRPNISADLAWNGVCVESRISSNRRLKIAHINDIACTRRTCAHAETIKRR